VRVEKVLRSDGRVEVMRVVRHAVLARRLQLVGHVVLAARRRQQPVLITAAAAAATRLGRLLHPAHKGDRVLARHERVLSRRFEVAPPAGFGRQVDHRCPKRRVRSPCVHRGACFAADLLLVRCPQRAVVVRLRGGERRHTRMASALHVTSRHLTSCRGGERRHTMMVSALHVTSRHLTSCRVMSRHVTSPARR
jgi:hypothetical protein